MNQRGFATLEVILMVVVIGILASVAVPRFTDVTTKANTAKIQSDLSTIDTAIEVYFMEHGDYPDDLSDLKDYLRGVEGDNPDLKPPKGYAYVNGEETPRQFSEDTYKIKVETSPKEARAYLEEEEYTAEKFYAPRNNSSDD